MKTTRMTTLLTTFFMLCFYGGAYAATWVNTSGATNTKWSNSKTDPGWDTDYPNGQGAVAIFPASSKKNSVTMDVDCGVTLGSLILDAGTQNTDFQFGSSVSSGATLTFDQDGNGPGYAVISNTSKRARVNLGADYEVNLADDLFLVNRGDENYTPQRTYSISITGPITGKGNLTIDSDQIYTNGCVAITGHKNNSFTGETHVVSGCLKVQNAQGNKPFGIESNIVRLGRHGGSEAKILLDGSSPKISNPIVVEGGAVGELSLGVVVLNAATFTSTFAGALTLNGPVSFDVPLFFVKNNTSYYGTNVVSGAISGVGRLTKKNNGVLKIASESNDWSGGATVSNGTLVVAAGSTLGTGPLDVCDGATLDLASDVTVASVSLNGKLQQKGVYAALGSDDPKAFKVAWLTGVGKLTATEGRVPGLSIIIR